MYHTPIRTRCKRLIWLLCISMLTTGYVQAQTPDKKKKVGVSAAFEFEKKFGVQLGDAQPMSFVPEAAIKPDSSRKPLLEMKIPPYVPFAFPGSILPKKRAMPYIPERSFSRHRWHPHYISLGLGNYTSPALGARYSPDKHWVATAAYQGNLNGEVDAQNSAQHRADLNLSGNYRLDQRNHKTHLKLTGHYGYRQVHFYGYTANEELLTPEAKDIRRTAHQANLEAGMRAVPTTLSSDLFWGGELRSGYWGGDRQDQEWRAELNGWAGKSQVDDELGYRLEIALRADQFTDSTSSQLRALGSVTPAVEQTIGRFSYRAGVRVSFLETDSLNYDQSLFFYPEARLGVQVVPRWLFLQAEASGGMQAQSYQKFFEQNPFLAARQRLRHTNESYRFALSLRSRPVSRLRLSAELSLGRYQNLAFFRNNAQDSSQFDIVYRREGINKLAFAARAAYQHKDFQADATVEMRRFSFDRQEEAWYTPQLEATLGWQWHFLRDWYWSQHLAFTGARFAPLPGSDTETVRLNSILHVNVRVGYSPDPHWRLFAEVKNALNQSYEQYLYYPVLRLQGRLGLSYHFGQARSSE